MLTEEVYLSFMLQIKLKKKKRKPTKPHYPHMIYASVFKQKYFGL